MDKYVSLRLPKRLLRASLVLAVALVVAIPIGVSASHQFTDVSDSNIFHDNIGWLADAGVTLGCNPPANDRFCPEDNVTRQQMAAFLQRLAEAKVVDAATAVTADDAQLLDGMDSTAFALKSDLVVPLAGYDGGNDYGEYAKGTWHKLRTVTLNPAADGTAIATFSIELGEGTDGEYVGCSVSNTGAAINSDQSPWSPTPGVSTFDVLSATRGFDVVGGSPLTIDLFCIPAFSNTSPDTEMRNSNLTVVFVPNP